MGAGAVYKFLMSVDARGSGRYLDNAKLRMRRRIYACADDAFDSSGVGRSLIHREDRGDGFLAAVDARVPPAQLIGPWLAELYQVLRDGNEELSVPLGLRVGMHVGPVQHDDDGLAGEAVDQVCRLAESDVTRDVLAHSGRDLVCVVSDSLYQAIVKHGGRFMEPSTYRPARLMLKEGPLTAWYHIPGETRPAVPGDAEFGAFRGAGAAPEGDGVPGTGPGHRPVRISVRTHGPLLPVPPPDRTDSRGRTGTHRGSAPRRTPGWSVIRRWRGSPTGTGKAPTSRCRPRGTASSWIVVTSATGRPTSVAVIRHRPRRSGECGSPWCGGRTRPGARRPERRQPRQRWKRW